MGVKLSPGDTILLALPNPGKKHLFVVVTKTNIHLNNFLGVPFCTWDHGINPDPTTVVYPGEHPFITTKSYLNYKHSEILTLDMVESWLLKRDASIRENVSEELLGRIRAGINQTKKIPRGNREYFNANYWPLDE